MEIINFEYKGFGGTIGICRLTRNGNVVMGTELKESTATSITNVAESLATSAADHFGIPLNELIWIEHYESDDSFDLVNFSILRTSFIHADWRMIDSTTANNILLSGSVLNVWDDYFSRR